MSEYRSHNIDIVHPIVMMCKPTTCNLPSQQLLFYANYVFSDSRYYNTHKQTTSNKKISIKTFETYEHEYLLQYIPRSLNRDGRHE